MTLRAGISQLGVAAADLALGGACAGCAGSPGLLCSACRAELARPPRLVERSPAGLSLVVTTVYGGVMRSMVLAHKESGRLALSRPLGQALAAAIDMALDVSRCSLEHPGQPVALVPAPSARAATRRRGHDPMLRIARRAGVVLRRAGCPCAVLSAVRHCRPVADQAGLGQGARIANLYQSMTVRRGAEVLLRGRCVVIVDDVVTTGATVGEVARALRSVGVQPCGVAAIAESP